MTMVMYSNSKHTHIHKYTHTHTHTHTCSFNSTFVKYWKNDFNLIMKAALCWLWVKSPGMVDEQNCVWSLFEDQIDKKSNNGVISDLCIKGSQHNGGTCNNLGASFWLVSRSQFTGWWKSFQNGVQKTLSTRVSIVNFENYIYHIILRRANSTFSWRKFDK